MGFALSNKSYYNRVMELTKKVYIKTGLIYCGIMLGAFLVTNLLLNLFISFIDLSSASKFVDYLFYNKALEKIPMYVIAIFSSLQLVPLVLIVMYVCFTKPKNMKVRFINYPIALCSLVILIQVPSLVLLALNFILKLKTMSFFEKGSSSILFLYAFLDAIFTFSSFYLVLNSIHTKFVLPKYFPDGNINNEKGLFKISLSFLFKIVYISVLVLPMFVLIVTYLISIDSATFHENTIFHLFFVFFIIFGLVICRHFISYFAVPLERLKEGTQRIADGDYSHGISVVSADIFGELADSFNNMTNTLDVKSKRLVSVQNSVVTGMATMVESRDNSTGGHIKRTSQAVRVFAEALKKSPGYAQLPEEFFNNVVKAAPMHDLGKIAVLDAILRKPGRFTAEEYDMMKAHAAEGARIVENVLHEVDDLKFKEIAINVAHYHHEKWDGSGYPEKISGETIPLEARIMALADVFDALVSKRCYKESFSFDKAFQIIEESLGSHFDPELGKVFLTCRPELETLYGNIK